MAVKLPIAVRTCADCPGRIARLYARYCDNCRWRHRGRRTKWVWTPERDQLLRERYDPKIPGTPKRLAAALGVPRHAVVKRAGFLGLAKLAKDRKPWTPADVAFLEEHLGTRHVRWIAKRLARSATSVVMKTKHMHISRRVREGLTMRDLELCLGADHRQIEGWVRAGKLKAAHEGGLAHPRERWTFREPAVLSFMLEHPMAFRLDKVDQTWFMGLFHEATTGRLKLAA